ncbi:peptidoglycan DD-metalloendopeptidase family protein [Vibrio algarum]|uniref:Peptidoglycan DD-metalloendopeptidase family protein n=1 Tax=Vibrio algarum TaxID=3020714 RepID=A0ABT4YPG1_9VIBR|nr:peptidoglycan DD-metalloendopeptidase family protein [Vibrio sp. KJ40-1]MDB1123081.1 peptidoglycan DD-metalloendopeptidase family protein [Vibrio sp. KJ40-1]
MDHAFYFFRLPIIHRSLILILSALISAALFLPDSEDLAIDQTTLEVGQHYPVAISMETLETKNSILPDSVVRWEKYKIASGESAAKLFNRIGLSAQLLHQLITSDKEINNQLSRLRVGEELSFGFDENNELLQIKRVITPFETFRITKAENGYAAAFETKTVDIQFNYTEAEITSNFWNAALSANLTPTQIMELAGIFGWDIDFALDIRSGDSFKVLYEEKIVEGEKMGRGRIIAAIFSNQGETFKAILDDNTGNYFDENGRAMKKAFLRSPIDFRRVTSNFNPKRRHPVTGKVTAHRGTDYAAPVGTPIWAAGDGIVDKSGYNQFNGNYVFIRHSNTYITKYLHMKRRYVKTGQRVKQGQSVGTLGGTGRVTGPHLHYEFLVNGVHKNPRTVKLPQSKSLKGAAKTEFMTNANDRLVKLEQYGRLLFANQH